MSGPTFDQAGDPGAHGAGAPWPEIRQQPDVWRQVARLVEERRPRAALRGVTVGLLS